MKVRSNYTNMHIKTIEDQEKEATINCYLWLLLKRLVWMLL